MAVISKKCIFILQMLILVPVLDSAKSRQNSSPPQLRRPARAPLRVAGRTATLNSRGGKYKGGRLPPNRGGFKGGGGGGQFNRGGGAQYDRPGAGGGGGLGSAFDLGDILSTLDLNLLDLKAIGLGYIRPGLVDTLCTRATNALISEGNTRARDEINTLQSNLTSIADKRCSELVGEAEGICSTLIAEILTRYNNLLAEATGELETQCDGIKGTTVDGVRSGANETYQMVAEVSRMLAEETFKRTVAEGLNQGEKDFQEAVEEGRKDGEEVLRKMVAEGRADAERQLAEGRIKAKEEGEAELAKQVAEGRAEAEKTFQARVAEERAQAQELFDREAAREREKADEMFDEMVAQGRVEGEGTCGEMIALACKNVTEGTASDDFCLDFCFFSDACE